MLSGVFIRNFKCYQATQFVPIFSNKDDNFVGFLGDNGVGKSAILEALDCFFSKKPNWLRNKDAKTGPDNCFVAPLFVLNTKSIGSTNKHFKNLQKLSDEIRKNVKISQDNTDNVFICVARREDGSLNLYDGKKELIEDSDKKLAHILYEYIVENFKYIYIDAEVDIDEAARINSKIYEIIIGSSIVSEIDKIFKKIDGESRLLDELNAILSEMVDKKITAGLKKIDPNYSYGVSAKGFLSRLTTNVLANASAFAFLDSRKLKYGKTQLDNLSSGQRRIVLLDFLVAVLEGEDCDKRKKIILAIDEPEISIDSGKKMWQFEKLFKIATGNTSVLFTSHWYGWIAGLGGGKSVLIQDRDSGIKKDIKEYNNSDFPFQFQDIPKYEMRMIFDFLMSLGASVENNPEKKYIICEGPSDKFYLSASLNDENYVIFYVGKGRVKKIADIFYGYYWKKGNSKLKNILFLIDTDPEQDEKFSDNIYLKRWSRNDKDQIVLVSNNENLSNKCEIEDSLNAEDFLEALRFAHPEAEIIKNLKIKYENLTGVDAFGMDRVTQKKFEEISKSNKVLVSSKYAELIKRESKELFLTKIITEEFNK